MKLVMGPLRELRWVIDEEPTNRTERRQVAKTGSFRREQTK